MKFNPPDVVDKLHKLDEKHYTYGKPGDGDYLAYSSVQRRFFYALLNHKAEQSGELSYPRSMSARRR